VWIAGSDGLNSIINGAGGPANSTNPGTVKPADVTSYPWMARAAGTAPPTRSASRPALVSHRYVRRVRIDSLVGVISVGGFADSGVVLQCGTEGASHDGHQRDQPGEPRAIAYVNRVVHCLFQNAWGDEEQYRDRVDDEQRGIERESTPPRW
jgi:hypothetical protein